jgi:broad specificity phosphatase PhoE
VDGVVRVFLARHPETEANVARRFVGAGDTPYTALGHLEAATPWAREHSDLGEIGFGEAEGLTYAEASDLGISMDLLGGPSESAFAGGEPWADLDQRVRRALAAVVLAGERVAVVTHSGPVRALLTVMLELPAEAAWRFAIAPASVTQFTVGEDFAVLEGFGLPPEASPL